jgi:exosortase D (VPLPA-CTERM-specific)
MTFSESLKNYRLQLLAILPLLVGIYYLIVPDMVLDWYRDENYSHGFLVPLIAGYFLWQRWPGLKDQEIKPDRLGIVVVILGLLQLVLGWLATEYFTMRSSMLLLAVGCVLFWFGWEVLKKMSLPIGFCIFMVPIPYIIYDMVAFPLKLFVTKVSVALLGLAGVVVMREGNIIVFPATTLEVADACSGIRSLISLLALAVAFAFFVQTSNTRRWIIIASAVPIAIATNSLRVIGTGFLAQWWGAKAAEGFFHEFAGMMVFVLAMVLLVAVGACVKGDVKLGEPGTDQGIQPAPGSNGKIGWNRFASVYFLLALVALFLNFHADKDVPTSKPLSEFPQQVAGWTMSGHNEFSANILKVLKPTDYLSRVYRRADGTKVELYVGYHNGGKGTGGIHSPKHCLPGSGWFEVSSEKIVLPTPSGNRDLVRAVYQKGGSKEMFLYWFQMMDRSITDEYALKLTEIKNSLLYQRRDQTFIRISLPFDQDEARTMGAGAAFVRDFDGPIREFLPR